MKLTVTTPPLPEIQTVTVGYLPEEKVILSNCRNVAAAFAMAAKQPDNHSQEVH